MKIAHIVNLYTPQPGTSTATDMARVTESMQVARSLAASSIEVELLSAHYEEDRSVVPPGFRHAPPLTRSVLDYGSFRIPRRFPLIADVIERLVGESSPDILVYTNTDIVLMPHFYLSVGALFRDGTRSAVINRRTIPRSDVPAGATLAALYPKIGSPHPGYDCFVFTPKDAERFFLGRVCIGVPGIGRALYYNVRGWSHAFQELSNLHLTFHIGDDRPWKDTGVSDYVAFNRAEVAKVCSHLAPHCDIERLKRDAFWHSLPLWKRVAVYARWLAPTVLRRLGQGAKL